MPHYMMQYEKEEDREKEENEKISWICQMSEGLVHRKWNCD